MCNFSYNKNVTLITNKDITSLPYPYPYPIYVSTIFKGGF